MRTFERLGHLFRTWFRRSRLDRDLDAELDDWVEMLAERHRAQGLDAAAARAAARRELGGVDRLREHARSLRAGAGAGPTTSDVKYAWRALRHAPGFSATVILTFALGIGASTAIFSVVKAVLLEPLPYREPDRLAFVWADATDLGYPRAPLAGPELADFITRATHFEHFAGIWATTSTLTGDGDPEQLRIATVTRGFFQLLGVPPAHGRLFDEKDFGQTVRPVILSDALFQRRFGGDPAIVGRTIQMSGRPALVVGVMPATFRLWFPPDAAVPEDLQAWVPGGPRPAVEPRGQQYLRVIGRVKPGVAMTAAVRQIASIGRDIVRESPNSYSPGYTFFSVPMADDSVRAIRPALLSLLAAVSLLMVIACVNVAALLTVRAAARRQEAAVRIALGASRARLLRQFLAEGLVLAGLGGVAGVLLARAGLAALLALAPPALSRVALARVDGGVLLLAFAVAVGWGALFSLAPMVEVLSPRLADAIGSGTRAASSRLGQRVRRTLVVAQVAFGVVLLVGATLLARGFDRVLRIDPGFNADNTLTFRIAPSAQRLQGAAGVNVFHRELAAEIRALPGVTSVGAISHLPYDNLPNWGTPYLPDGVTDERQAGLADARNVAPGFFETVGARLIAGRFFTEDDTFQRPELVIVVDDLFARRIFPGQDPVGKIVRIDANLSGNPVAPARIIGVVGHLRHRALTEPGREQIFVSSRQIFRNPVAYVVRASGDLAALTGPIRAAVRARDPLLPVYDVRPLDTYLESARAASRFTMTVAAVFAAVALVLAAVGVYGVVAYAASLRRREFGIRLALGAKTQQIAWLVVGEGSRLTIAGLTLGLVGAAAAARLLESQLYEIAPLDPISYAIAGLVLAAAALTACGLPAARAATAPPMTVLKDE